ncbi:alpha/beta fold hydrolase [Streptomyces sp. NPDC093089]|uniref:alpha/beta fold hydrolase n=1 Tax=Streptomyces sp. NPDC093089 TaxID=3366024 RepID=UPI00382C91A2
MPSSIYRSQAAQDRIRSWCAQRLSAWPVAHERRRIDTAAGPTGVVVVEAFPGVRAATVVLIPGTNMNAAVSTSLMEALAEVGRLVVLDVPGQPGLSSGRRPRSRSRMDWYAGWPAEALPQVTREPAVVVGHSLGAAIALACPSDLIAGRVLVSPGGLMRLRLGASALGATLPWLLRPSASSTRKLLGCMTGPEGSVQPELAAWMQLVGRSCRSSLAPSPLPAAALDRARSTPCLVMVGSRDTFLPHPALGPTVERRLGVPLHVIPGMGHLVPEEAPARMAALVAEFLPPRDHGIKSA